MKRFASLVIACSFLLVTLSAFAQSRAMGDHIGNYNFKVEIEGITKGVVKLKTNKLQKLTCPTKKQAMNFYEGWPSKIKLKALKGASTVIIKSGEKSLRFSGVNQTTFNKTQKAITFKFKTCK